MLLRTAFDLRRRLSSADESQISSKQLSRCLPVVLYFCYKSKLCNFLKNWWTSKSKARMWNVTYTAQCILFIYTTTNGQSQSNFVYWTSKHQNVTLLYNSQNNRTKRILKFHSSYSMWTWLVLTCSSPDIFPCSFTLRPTLKMCTTVCLVMGSLSYC